MGYALNDGISVCRTSGRLIFLDVRADRYFCVEPRQERALSALIDGGSPGPDDLKQLDVLVAEEVLRWSSNNLPNDIASCAAYPILSASLLDLALPRPTPASVGVAIAALTRTRLRLRTRGLAAALDAAARVRPAHRDEEGIEFLIPIVAAFEGARRFATAHDQCLVRSLAITGAARRRGHDVALHIGVQLHPFRAHSWVSSSEWLVNDRAEVVRPFTPILRL